MNEVKWEWVESFVAVVMAGSMRLASSSAISQPTLSRHITALEDYLGYKLFDRAGQRLLLTPLGLDFHRRAEQMCQERELFFTQARSASGRVDGTVRVSTSAWFSMTTIHDWLVEFRAANPGIRVELQIQNANVNLLQRDADIVLSCSPLDQLDVVAKRTGTLDIGFFASPDYIERRGRPTVETLKDHDLIGWDRDEFFIRAARRLGFDISARDFALRCDDSNVLHKAIERGLGVGVLWKELAAQTPELVEVLAEIDLPTLPIFIVSRADAHAHPRISTAVDSLREFMRAHAFQAAS